MLCNTFLGGGARGRRGTYLDTFDPRTSNTRALIVGHHDLNPQKDCPCIENVAREYADLQPR